ncbi:MAG: c-type cytochrome, partial [Acidobacteriota bacterium]
DGDSMLRRRAKIETADLRSDAIRRMPDGKIFSIISDGAGLMPGYRRLIDLEDRWAIVAWVRSLQREGERP